MLLNREGGPAAVRPFSLCGALAGASKCYRELLWAAWAASKVTEY